MYEIRQLEVPSAFIDLYTRRGRLLESREFIERRFETCDDLAIGVSDFCLTLGVKDGLDEATVLRRCHTGLLQTPATVTPREAAWVVGRAAELLVWDLPALDADDTPPG